MFVAIHSTALITWEEIDRKRMLVGVDLKLVVARCRQLLKILLAAPSFNPRSPEAVAAACYAAEQKYDEVVALLKQAGVEAACK